MSVSRALLPERLTCDKHSTCRCHQCARPHLGGCVESALKETAGGCFPIMAGDLPGMGCDATHRGRHTIFRPPDAIGNL